MNKSSDSDDSAFLFSMSLPQRRAGCDANNKLKKLRLSLYTGSKLDDEMEEQKRNESFESETIFLNPSEDGNEINLLEGEVLPPQETHAEDVDAQSLTQKLEDYVSCPLCLKNFHSESVHFTHMKQCAKKSNMSTKQLLEALQLHKKHLKERVPAGLSNIPTKKKKIQIQEENRDSTYQLAMALALSKSLLDDNVSGEKNHSVTDNVSMNNSSKTTLENFGFRSCSKKSMGIGKNSKSRKLTHSVLRERTGDERGKLVTEKASIVLLVNDYNVTSEVRESLRVYHCKRLEETRNKNSYLWKLGEETDVTEWYVEDLKNKILEEKDKIESKTHENLTHERCNIDVEILKLNLPKNKIFEDWRRLVNNKRLSDISLNSKDGKTIYLHSVVLYARCQQLLRSDLKMVFEKFDSSTILTFLQFLYCGTLNGMPEEEVENVLNLATSVDCKELVELLGSFKRVLFESKKNGGNWNDRLRPGFSFSPECLENVSFAINKLRESSCMNFSDLKDGISWNNTFSWMSERVTYKSVGYNEEVAKLRQYGKEEGSISNMFHEEMSRKPKSDGSLSRTDVQNDESTRQSIEKWNACCELDLLERDMFEEIEDVNGTVNRNVENDSNAVAKDKPECVEILRGSIKRDATHEEGREIYEENNQNSPEMDFDIPYFDPYEHFICDIPVADSEEQNILSQSMIVAEISPVKSSSPKRANPSCLDDASCISAPGCSSTPNTEITRSSISANTKFISMKFSGSARKKNKHGTPCSKISGKSERLSLKSRVFSLKSRRKKSGFDVDSEKLETALTESILKELNNSMGSPVRQTPPAKEKSYIEVTPVIPDEEYVDNVTPIPDYSLLGASSIKKHLSKYGLKKSLSKNQAKKILRHIYEELHPIINTKNGKIVKYIRSEKSKKCKRKKTGVKAKKKGNRKVRSQGSLTPTGRKEYISESCFEGNETHIKKKTSSFLDSSKATPSKSPRTVTEDFNSSWTSIDSDDGMPGDSGLTDEYYYEVEDPPTQGTYASAEDASAAVYDFIENNQDVHRQMLMYKSISLEDFQSKLLEKYNKKFRLTDLAECLEEECIVFHCESDKKHTDAESLP